MTPAEAQAFLDSRSQLGMRFGLDRMRRTLDALGRPERGLRVLHVAGTNGKGSTCAFASSVLRSAGLKVGMYTSPHLVRMNERIRVDGQDITDEAQARGVEALLAACPWAADPADPLTFFEVDTAIALRHFAQEKVDVAVLEVGLGGRLDATNAIERCDVALVTRIGLDHTKLLGDTLGAIAGEKAGIFKPAAHAVIARQEKEALDVLVAAAEKSSRSVHVAGRDFQLQSDAEPFTFTSGDCRIPGLSLSLLGPHQRENAESAIQAALLVEPELDARAIRAGLASAVWPGRLEVVRRRPLTLLDGAHNPDGARSLAQAMAALFPGKRIHLVFGVLADKDVSGVASRLVPMAAHVWLASPESERALAAEDLARQVAPLGVPCSTHPSIGAALDAATASASAEGEGSLVLVAGSLYVVGEAKAHLATG
ncbi:MAG TPA: folylpolyglutamate synthase/dihydrofolate synthase family protein [Myxococcales bacterium]